MNWLMRNDSDVQTHRAMKTPMYIFRCVGSSSWKAPPAAYSAACMAGAPAPPGALTCTGIVGSTCEVECGEVEIWSSTGRSEVGFGSDMEASARSHEVQEREEEDPHDIDEMP